MTDVTPTATRWVDMRFDQHKDAVCERWHGLQRRTLADAWDIGRGLRALKDQMQHGEWLPYLTEIGMTSSTAHRLMTLGEGLQISQLGKFASMDDALKALPAKRQKDEPAAQEPVEPTDAEGDAAMEEAAREHEEQRDHEAERDERDERLAMRLEGTDGDAVLALNDRLQKADERHRDDVRDVNETRRVANAVMREKLKIRDALLGIPRDAEVVVVHQAIDDVLARFFGVARK